MPKSGCRFSEKIVLKQQAKAKSRPDLKSFRLGRDFGRRVGIAIPVQLRHFLEQPVAEGDDLAARFDAGRFDQPIAARDRNGPIDSNGQSAGSNVLIDQRQAAHRDAKAPRGRFQGQLRRSQH
jgi:hypothetical protein